jgi:hypothetical protein
MPRDYGIVNNEYLGMVKAAYASNTNLIITHKVKDEWVANETTGEKIRNGMSETGYLVQLDLTTWRDEEGFHILVDKCRASAELRGETFDEPMNTFPYIASMVYEDTDAEDWE